MFLRTPNIVLAALAAIVAGGCFGANSVDEGKAVPSPSIPTVSADVARIGFFCAGGHYVGEPEKEIMDVQRFGDRLDVLAHDPQAAERILKEQMAAAGLAIDDVHIDNPTLENTFVSTLRSLGKTELHARQLSRRRGEIWCGLHGDRVRMAGNTVLYLSGRITV